MKSYRNAKEALIRIAKAFRREFFEDRASQGPAVKQVLDVFKHSLSSEHLEELKAYLEHGADPIYLDIDEGRGRKARTLPTEAKVELKLAAGRPDLGSSSAPSPHL